MRQAMRVLQLNAALIDYLSSWLGNDSRPGGVLSVSGESPAPPDLPKLKEDAEDLYGWHHRFPQSAPGHGRIAVMTGDLSYMAVDPPLREQEFIAQRELSAREVARAMRVPAWAIDAPTGDSLTYANVSEQNRALVTHSLRPWIVRLETAITNDTDLCPGGTYVQFDLDGLLRADAKTRADTYTLALNADTGWMRRDEVRELEDLPPEENP